MPNIAQFTLTLSKASTSAVSVDYATVGQSAVNFTDFTVASGTAVFPPNTTSLVIKVAVLAPLTGLTNKQFEVVLTNPQLVTLGTPSSAECVISGPPVYSAVPFPGRRVALLGDSITYMCNHWEPAIPSESGSPDLRYQFYGTGMTGWFPYANYLMNNALELEAALQPNTNPGVNATAANNGYNFAIYSSQVAQWAEPDFDPLSSIDTGSALAHNIGPYYNAQANISKFDIAIILGGTNDLSAGLSGDSIVTAIKTYAYGLAAAGKWVFVFTITPRTADLLQAVNGVGGYSQAQVVTIMQTLLYVNATLRTWAATNPANIFLVDPWNALIGPTASIIAGTPTDPAGMLSPSSGITTGSLIPAAAGNYRSDAPNSRFMFDGLHPAPPGAYVMGKVLAAALTAAGVPAAVPGQLGTLTIGPNLITNHAFTVSSTPRVLGGPLKLGRAIGLGAPIGWVSPGFPTGYAGSYIDHNANQGAGYTYGPMPDYWMLYRENNGNDGPSGVSPESFSNFNAYTYSSFTSGYTGGIYTGAVPSGYLNTSTWADGCLVTSIVSVGGVPGLQLDFTCPATGNANEGFVLRYQLGESQHGPADSYGYETGATATTITPPYSPGDYIAADAEIQYSNLSGNMYATRLACQFISVNNVQVGQQGNNDSSGAVISGIALVESFFPFSNIVNVRQHPENKTLFVRTPAVKAPTPASGENEQYLQLDFQFAFDCSVNAARATIVILAPRIAKITGPAL